MTLILFLKYRIKYIIGLLLLLVTCAHAQDTQEVQIANEYFSKGQNEKALEAYQALAKNEQNIHGIHNNYFNLLISMGKFKQGEDYLEKLIRHENRFSYRLDLGILYMKEGEAAKADKYFKSLLKGNADDVYRMKTAADYLSSYNLLDYAVEALLQARATGGRMLYNLELANLYRLQGKRTEMINVYLDYVTQIPSNNSYTKNLLQVLLTKPEELEALEQVLYERVQQNQQSEVFADLLIWVNLQQKNFYGAFVQARAFDKRFKKEQSKTLEIGQIALSNSDYENAIKSFSFVTKEFARTENYLPAELGIIKAREAKVKKAFPVNRDSVRYLIGEYRKFKNRNLGSANVDEADLSAAMLHAYYLDELDSAVANLSGLVINPKISPQLKAQAKIDLGDIFLLKNEPWESTLLYSQVEKSQHESPLGYEAKLRNAKLWYFGGEFRLAEEHLNILKQATTREIANDAMDLSMRIKENITFDTTGAALKEFSHIELLVYQNKLEEAIKKLEEFKSETSPGIKDDVYWLEANLLMKEGKFVESIAKLQKIQDEFGDDILADDAYFLQGDIYEHQLKVKEKSMEIYREFLNKYPGSVYAAEARKRYRVLRGDFVDTPNQ
jgi:tetratricopeptide (TPR) repeat protein